jgi:deoxyadenosine/deoxycytidine kinase
MKIGLCGTMSVGKTTLTKALAKLPQFENFKVVTERSKYLNSLGIPLNHKTTIEGQTVFLAERVTELMQENIITDRTIIDVMAFTECAIHTSVINADAFKDYAKRFVGHYDYIFYISPEGLAIEDNGVRETNEQYRNKIDKSIRGLLKQYRNKTYTIKGTTEERIKQILEIVNL